MLHGCRTVWDFSNETRKAVPYQWLSLDAGARQASILFMFRNERRRSGGQGNSLRGRG